MTEKTADDFRKFEARFGSTIKFVKADASTKEGIEVLREELQKLPKLAGIINSGAVLDDKLFQEDLWLLVEEGRRRTAAEPWLTR